MESNNTCKQIEINLDAFHDGELTPEERVVVESHLKGCSDCLNKLAEIDRLVHTLRTMPRMPVTADLSSRLDSLIDQQTRVVPMRSKVWMPATAVAAAVVAIVFGVRAFQPSATTSEPQFAAVQTNKPLISRTADTGPALQQPIAAAPDQTIITTQRPKPTSKPKTMIAAETTNTVQVTEAAQIATLPDNASISSFDNDMDYLAELPTVSDSFADAVGFATDEDGLYDLKM